MAKLCSTARVHDRRIRAAPQVGKLPGVGHRLIAEQLSRRHQALY
jgi:hypothetical protein